MVPTPIIPLIASIFIREIRTNTSPVGPANPTDGQFTVDSVNVGWDAYTTDGHYLGTYVTTLAMDAAAAIPPTTVSTQAEFAALERGLLHALVTQAEGLVNAS